MTNSETGRKIILFGATGYTGHLVAEALVDRQLRPILCGRDKGKLERLAGQLGGLETAVVTLNDDAAFAELLSRGDVLISTVGPFAEYGRTAVMAAIDNGATYIDTTGEPAFIRAVFENYDPPARSANVALLPACGYDYVPGNCAAAMALEAAGPDAVRIDIGYYSKKKGSIASLDVSQGTQASLRMAMIAPVKVWRGGQMISETGGIHVRTFDVDGVEHPGLTVSGTEHFSLPRCYPHLEEINTYLGWFGKGTYWMQRGAMLQSALSGVPGYTSLARFMLSRLPGSTGKGPNAAQRKENISHIVAEAFDAQGRLLARKALAGVDGYTFTARFMAWAAQAAHQGKISKTGAIGPLEAFGWDDLVKGCAQSGITAQ